jgi:hypothetical protein
VDEEDWETFLGRAIVRGRQVEFEYEEHPMSEFEGWEQLWEIGCKVREIDISDSR